MENTITIPDIVGITGVGIILIAYFLLQKGTMTLDHISYHIWNLIGAVLILISLIFSWNLASFIIEICWIAISIYGILKLIKRRKSE